MSPRPVPSPGGRGLWEGMEGKMSKIFFLLAVAVGVVAILLWIGPGQAAESIKMGYIGNFSWPVAADAFYAAKLAVDEINKAGGIQGRQVELLSEDSRGQTPMATAAYKKLVMTKGAIMVMIAEGSEINFACQEAGADLYPEFKHIAMNTCTSHEGTWGQGGEELQTIQILFSTIPQNYLLFPIP